jgi:hypothetical protein
MNYLMENILQLYILENNQREPSWLFLRIYKLECILLHNTFPSTTVFSFYFFTFLIFRKLNKPQLTKVKQQNITGIRAFDFRLYLDISKSFKWKESFIFRYFKVFQVSQMFTGGLSNLLLLAVASLVVFVLREYILKVHMLVSSEHKLCQIWNTCIVSCMYWSIAFLYKLLICFFNKAYYQESYILIIELSSVVTVAERLDGSIECQKAL